MRHVKVTRNNMVSVKVTGSNGKRYDARPYAKVAPDSMITFKSYMGFIWISSKVEANRADYHTEVRRNTMNFPTKVVEK